MELLNNDHEEHDPIEIPPKSTAEIVADKNFEIVGYKNEITALKDSIHKLEQDLLSADQTLVVTKKDLAKFKLESETLKIKLDYLHDMHDDLLEKIMDKI